MTATVIPASNFKHTFGKSALMKLYYPSCTQSIELFWHVLLYAKQFSM